MRWSVTTTAMSWTHQTQGFLGARGQGQGEGLAKGEAERVQVVALVVDHQDGKLRQFDFARSHAPDENIKLRIRGRGYAPQINMGTLKGFASPRDY